MVLGVPMFKHFRVIDDTTCACPEQTVNLYVCSEHAVGSLKEHIVVQAGFVFCHSSSIIHLSTISNNFSESTQPIIPLFYIQPPGLLDTKIHPNGLGYMTNIANTPIKT